MDLLRPFSVKNGRLLFTFAYWLFVPVYVFCYIMFEGVGEKWF
jgi:hypothetical protein